MTTFGFSEEDKPDFKGQTPTHWTHYRMKYCSYINGRFSKDLLRAAKDSLVADTFNSYGDPDGIYHDCEELMENNSLSVTVYGLVCDDNKYYWTGDVKRVVLNLNITIFDNI